MRAVPLLVLLWAGLALAGERTRVERTEPFLAPLASAELRDETRPVARDVLRGGEGSARVVAGPVRVPAHARLEVWFGVEGAESDRWQFDLRAKAGSRDLHATASAGGGEGWLDLGLDVSGIAGEEATIELVGRPERPGGGGRPVLGAPRFVVWRDVTAQGRNVIVVSLDTLRADRLSSYGAARPTSPQIDALAADGVRFATALAPASSTPPSHMTLLTGTSPCRHGVWGVHLEDDLPDEIETLAEVLGRDGYTTAAITENAYVAAPYGFARGFDSYVELKQMVADRNSPSPGVITPTGYAPKTFAAAGRWLRSNATRRFLLFVHTYQVHGPRRPTGEYAELFPEPSPSGTPRPGFDPAFHDLRRYDQLVRQLDDLVGGMVHELTMLGIAGETILVLTSDHGEAFFEHDDHGHGWSVFGEVLRVPLVVWAPGLARPSVVEAPVGLVDLTPTVLELLNLPVPGGLDGRSLADVVRTGKGEPPSRAYYAETAPGNARSLRQGRFKIIRGKDEEEDSLFDLENDPGERAPVRLSGELPEALAGEQARIAALRAGLDRRAAACEARRREADRLRDAKAAPDPARHEKLRALGYVE